MKRLMITLVLVLTTIGMMAVPAKKGIKKMMTLPDGTMVEAQLMGDEHLHFWQTDDGMRLVEVDSNGHCEPADMEKMIQKAQNRQAKASMRRQQRARRASIGDFTNYQGKKKGLIILVEFSDESFAAGNDSVLYDRICNEEGFSEGKFVGSVHDYFKSQSYGKFDLTFDVVGPVKMSKPYQYYGKNVNDNDIRPGEMVATACIAVQDYVNYSDYDWDGDGWADQVMCIYAGYGEADGGEENTIWPHEWSLSSSDYGHVLELQGIKIDTYAVSNERSYSGIEGIGTICHEFSHCLGIPDMYDTRYQGNYGMHVWSLMDQGSYNGDGFCPSGYTSFERYTCGWLTPTELDHSQHVEEMKPLSQASTAYMIRNSAHYDEYYLLENRQLKGWDACLPEGGLLILYVDYDRAVWENNLVNTQSSYYSPVSSTYQHCTPFRASNSKNQYSAKGDTYPYNSKDSLTNTSVPAATLNHKNANGSLFMDKGILQITRNDNKTVSFYFRNSKQGKAIPGNALFYESFDECSGVGGNDGYWKKDMATSRLFFDNEGWETVKGYGGYNCARFGNMAQQGMATTPDINIDGEATITFKAAAWTDDEQALRLSASDDNATIEPEVLNMNTLQWTELTATIRANGPVKITFEPTQRFLLDDILVVPSETSAITQAKTSAVGIKPQGIYNLQGQKVESPVKGLYIINGKKTLIK